MNDPGLDDPIADAADAVQDKYNYSGDADAGADETEQEEERSFLRPARWWWASTAFPLVAGTFGPMANAFSVCALVENWRVEIPPGGTEEHGIDIADPRWLIAVNAVSLVFALIANLTLLLNMAQRIPFKIAQPFTIAGFWLASILLIALIIVAGSDDSKHFRAPGVKDQALTQAYYYAIFAAGLYQMISYLMMFTIYGALKGHYSKEFKLTISQRTLMLQTISFMVYLLLGALVYSHIEGWKFLDAVYWADFTLLTIGIGDDYTPATHTGRALLFPFAIGGIVILGLVVGSIRSLVLERTKKKLGARMTEKTRRKVVARIQKAEQKNADAGGNYINKIKGLNKDTAKCLTMDPNDHNQSEKRRRQAEFNAMREVQWIASRERKWVGLTISGLAWLFLWLIGAVIFWKAEKNQDWTYFEGIYFAYTTLLTIGYGDFQPESNSGKAFFVFWSLLAVPTLTILISNMGDTVVTLIKDGTIYLGEVTVLPSEKRGVRRSFKLLVMKLNAGRINVKGLKEEDDGVEEAPPGLIHMPHQHGNATSRHNPEDLEAIQNIAADFAAAEKMDEDEARRQGDHLAEDIHHYRHLLITEIRNVYQDVGASEPKKYTYDEWAYYLGLLGEDESDAKFHRKAPIKPHAHEVAEKLTNEESTATAAEEVEKKMKHNSGQKHGLPEDEEYKRDGEKIKQWSWMGNRSPLMGDKDEAEWILEKLFQRLETELLKERKLAQKIRKQKIDAGEDPGTGPGWPLAPGTTGTDDGRGSGESSDTLEGENEKGSRSRSK